MILESRSCSNDSQSYQKSSRDKNKGSSYYGGERDEGREHKNSRRSSYRDYNENKILCL